MSEQLSELAQPEAMIFDLDGTLFMTETLLIPAYHSTFEQLRKEGIYTGETPPEERILRSLGMLLEHIWENVIPETSKEVRDRASDLLLEYQLSGLKEGVGELYPEVKTTLQALQRRGIRLFIASNGLEPYVKEVIAEKGLTSLFEGLYSAGEFNTSSKVDLVRMLIDNHKIGSAYMVGDRSSDVEAGKGNGLTVIGCDYAGFGDDEELDGADQVINAFSELALI